jgi:hypothetical protein
MPRYVHIRDATHGAIPITTVNNIDFDEDAQELADSGDDDVADSFLMEGKSTTRGTMMIKDPVQAYALKAAASANLVFKGVSDDASEVQVTLSGVKFFRLGGRQMHNGVWNYPLTFRAYKADGTRAVLIAPVVP